MGKWATRLAEKTAAPPSVGTDESAKRGLVSVLAVTPERGAREYHAVSMLAGEPASQNDAPDLAAVAWTDANISAFLGRRARLLRWGWPEATAEALAERLTLRDRGADTRVSCSECRHYRPGRCGNHAAAGLHAADVGRDLASMLQHCPGFVS